MNELPGLTAAGRAEKELADSDDRSALISTFSAMKQQSKFHSS